MFHFISNFLTAYFVGIRQG